MRTRTVLYLLRHGATEANLTRPARLQGQRQNPPLAPLGVRQAEATRDFLAIRPFDHCYSSPLLRAMQTVALIAAPHGLTPEPLPGLIECDIGRWEGLDWGTIRSRDPEHYHRFMANPAEHGYPGGESFTDAHRRAVETLEPLWQAHPGQTLLVVGHHIVTRTYLAGVLGLGPDQARRVILDNCGISIVVREEDKTTVATLNAAFHLQGIAA
jgi:broad specificity phosphatase PhoE